MSSQAAGISEIHLEELLTKGHLRVALLALRGAPLALSEAASEIGLAIAIRLSRVLAHARASFFHDLHIRSQCHGSVLALPCDARFGHNCRN